MQFLSKKWIPYEEICEYLIRDKESKIISAKATGHLKACIFFMLGIIFMCLLSFTQFFKG